MTNALAASIIKPISVPVQSPDDIATAAKEMRAKREKLGIDGREVTPSDVKTDSAWVIFLANEKLKATIAERIEQRSQA